jgi:acyl carrier protein
MEIKPPVRRFIRHQFSLGSQATLSDDTSLLQSGLIDSAGTLELIIFLESEFDISVNEQEVVPENLDTIDRIASFVERKRSASKQEGAEHPEPTHP